METCGVITTYHRSFCWQEHCDCKENSGERISEEYFQNGGKKEGIYKKYYSNGIIEKKHNYIDGKLNGICKWYFPNGLLQKESIYIENGIVEIYKKYYDEYGLVIEKNNILHYECS